MSEDISWRNFVWWKGMFFLCHLKAREPLNFSSRERMWADLCFSWIPLEAT